VLEFNNNKMFTETLAYFTTGSDVPQQQSTNPATTVQKPSPPLLTMIDSVIVQYAQSSIVFVL
jgi:hypothetical protein